MKNPIIITTLFIFSPLVYANGCFDYKIDIKLTNNSNSPVVCQYNNTGGKGGQSGTKVKNEKRTLANSETTNFEVFYENRYPSGKHCPKCYTKLYNVGDVSCTPQDKNIKKGYQISWTAYAEVRDEWGRNSYAHYYQPTLKGNFSNIQHGAAGDTSFVEGCVNPSTTATLK